MLSQPLLTVHEVAERLQMKESTVREFIKSKELRAIRLGREYRVAVKDLEAFLNEHANKEPTWS